MDERQGGWRRLLRSLHRDVGYLCFGLTVAYALTGVLLNHLHDWNSSYRVEKVARTVAPFPDPPSFAEGDVPGLLGEIGEKETPTGIFRPDPATVQIFFQGGRMITADLRTGRLDGEIARRRPVLGTLNALHLNRAGRAWTIFSDLYAVALGFLAVTGIVILKGREGLAGRGWRLAVLGLAVPVLLILAVLSR